MRFCFEHKVPVARETVFAFFENPERLELLHAGWSQIRLLHHETQIRVGAQTWIELTVAGFVPLVLGFRHILFEPPVQFGEEAIHGPFSRFVHIHRLEAASGDTIVHDLLEVCLPWHYGGEAIMRRVLAPQIVRMFQHRAQALSRLASEGTLARCASQSASSKER